MGEFYDVGGRLVPKEEFESGQAGFIGFGPFSGDPQIELEVQQEHERFLAEEAVRERGEWPTKQVAGLTTGEEVALAMANFYDIGYGHIPNYQEEALADALRRKAAEEQIITDDGPVEGK